MTDAEEDARDSMGQNPQNMCAGARTMKLDQKEVNQSMMDSRQHAQIGTGLSMKGPIVLRSHMRVLNR